MRDAVSSAPVLKRVPPLSQLLTDVSQVRDTHDRAPDLHCACFEGITVLPSKLHVGRDPKCPHEIVLSGWQKILLVTFSANLQGMQPPELFAHLAPNAGRDAETSEDLPSLQPMSTIDIQRFPESTQVFAVTEARNTATKVLELSMSKKSAVTVQAKGSQAAVLRGLELRGIGTALRMFLGCETNFNDSLSWLFPLLFPPA